MTGLEREPESPRLAEGKSPEELRAYLGDLSFPAKKDALVHAVRRNGAPEDVLGAMSLLPATEYHSFEGLQGGASGSSA
jgi:hypothetical protein